MKAPLEDAEQKAVVAWLIKRNYMVVHIPNHQKMRVDLGAVPGAPDLVVILEDAKVVWIEMKRRKNGTQSPAQIDFQCQLKQRGHYYILAKGAKQAVESFAEVLQVLGV